MVSDWGWNVAAARVNVEQLKRQLALRGWNGVDLAYHSGVTPATVSAAMQGREVSTTTIAKIAAALVRTPVLAGVDELLA